MTTKLEIALAVLVVVFGLATLAFVIYFLVKKCCRDKNIGKISRSLRSASASRLQHNGNVAEAELGLCAFKARPPSVSQHPQYSCRYRRQTLDVFGAVSTGAQGWLGTNRLTLTAALQDYYEKTVPSDDIPLIEDVQVLPLRKTQPKIQKPLAAPEIRPKTYFELADRKGKQPAEGADVDVSHGMFISKTLDQSGGSLELYGVTLNVPPGALSSGQKICLGVLWASDHQPKLSRKEAMLSPIISCQPHGLLLQKDAILTVPHCAVDVSDDWTVTAWCSETTPTEAPDWRKLDRAKVELLPCRFKLRLNHFTLYAASGEGKSAEAKKWIDLVAFAPPLTGKEFPIRIYCLNDYTDDEARDVKKMAKSELKQKGKEVTSPKPLVFHNDGKNLQVEMEQICEPWSLSDIASKLEELDFEQIWHGLGPSCTFVLTSAENQSKVECSIAAYQKDHADKRQKLVVAEECQVTCNFRIDPETLYSVCPADLCDTIMKMLDPDVITENNWVALAEHMDIPLRDVHWLADDCRKCGKSPTIYLLNQFVQRGQTLDDFRSVMMGIERHDIVDELDKWRQSH